MLRRFAGLAMLVAVVLSCDEDGGIAGPEPVVRSNEAFSVGEEALQTVSERDPTEWSQMATADLWNYAAAQDSIFIVGFRKPGQSRGIIGSRWLTDASDDRAFRAALSGREDVSVVEPLLGLPAYTVKMSSPEALEWLRTFPMTDYIEPDWIEIVSEDGAGCSWEPASSSGLTRTSTGDYLPPHYLLSHVQVQNAWKRATGRGVILGLVDTGIHPDQNQLLGDFSSGSSSGRWYRYYGEGEYSWEGKHCSHGTRMAGTMAAPMNGKNMVGVAWAADLISVHRSNDVWDAFGSGANTANAIYKAATSGPEPNNTRRVIALAFRATKSSEAIKDQIRNWYAQNRLFVGASGNIDATGIIFPADMAEVIAVSTVTASGFLPVSGINYGSSVELTFPNVNLTHGRVAGDLNTLSMTSGSTAAISGIAALLWERFPTESNVQIRQRLRKAAHQYPAHDRIRGYGVPNAMKALGGLHLATIDTTVTSRTCETVYNLYARAHGGTSSAIAYRWSTGATTRNIGPITVQAGDRKDVSVTITDQIDAVSQIGRRALFGPDPEPCHVYDPQSVPAVGGPEAF